MLSANKFILAALVAMEICCTTSLTELGSTSKKSRYVWFPWVDTLQQECNEIKMVKGLSCKEYDSWTCWKQ